MGFAMKIFVFSVLSYQLLSSHGVFGIQGKLPDLSYGDDILILISKHIFFWSVAFVLKIPPLVGCFYSIYEFWICCVVFIGTYCICAVPDQGMDFRGCRQRVSTSWGVGVGYIRNLTHAWCQLMPVIMIKKLTTFWQRDKPNLILLWASQERRSASCLLTGADPELDAPLCTNIKNVALAWIWCPSLPQHQRCCLTLKKWGGGGAQFAYNAWGINNNILQLHQVTSAIKTTFT